MLARIKLRQEDRAERELYRLMSDLEWWYVLDLIEHGKFRFCSAYIYPILVRLEKQGVVESHWNEDVHPRRRQYRMKPQRPYESNVF